MASQPHPNSPHASDQPRRQPRNDAGERRPQRRQSPASRQTSSRPRGNEAPRGEGGAAQTDSPYGESIHAYAGKAALCFQESTTRGGVETITVEGAPSVGIRSYDWSKESKIAVQLTRAELPVVAATVMGFLPYCEYKSHGEAKDKGFSVEHQGDKLFIRVWSSAGSRAVPVEMPDAYYLSAMLLRQLRKNSPWMSGADIVMMLRTTVSRMPSQKR